MAAPKGNEFWRARSKHGRGRTFSSPEHLWESACEYFEYTDGRKWVRIDFKGKDADEVKIPTDTPYTIKGLCLFCGVTDKYWSDFKKNQGTEEGFPEVIARIEDIIYLQKFEGASVGAYNHNIMARELGLVDQKSHTGHMTLEELICGEDDE